MPGFELSRLAREDLVEIGVYGAERWGDERSERYVSDLYEVFQRLADGRARGRPCERIRPGLWRLEHASHVVSVQVSVLVALERHAPAPRRAGAPVA